MQDSGNVTAYHKGLKQESSLLCAGALGFAARAGQVPDRQAGALC